MDITKVSADILDGPNWGTWAVQIQVAARVLNCWAVIKGERIPGTTLPTYDLLAKPVQGTGTGQISNAALFAKSLFEWNKRNSTALGLLQGKLNPALWPDYIDVGDAAKFWTRLETKYRKAGGANTYLQFIEIIKQTFHNSSDLLSQIQKFQENYQCVLSNGYSSITEDLVVFMFCSTLPDSYQDTTRQYLDNVDDITKYKLQPIIDRVIQEESRREAQNTNASGSSSTINKFSTTKRYEKHCAKCGKNNHNTKDHWDTPPQRQGGGLGRGGSKKKSGQQKKKGGSSAKGKKPVARQKQITDGCINVLKITDVPESDFSSESINFSCYIQKEMSEWLMDSGCSKHITSHITDYIEYMPFDSPGKAEIADKKELDILRVGTIVICHKMMDSKDSNISLLQVLFMPTANGRFYSTMFATEKGCETHQVKGHHDVYSSDGTKFITGTCKATSGLFFFKAEVLQKQDSEATISVLKLNTHDLWHQCLGHTNLQVIKALPAHVIGRPATGVASPPMGLCDGCEKGKFKRLPFPPSKSRAETTLALVHSDLDEMSAASIDRYKWTATYLDDHTRYGMMFFLKHKDEQFDAFKTYKAWAERQTRRKLKSIHTDRGGEFLSKEQSATSKNTE